ALGEYFDLTEDDLAELLPSGQQSVFTNRVAWAKAHLKGAGLIESPSRGRYEIAQRGKEALQQTGQRIDLSYLKQFDEYRQFRNPKKDQNNRPDNGGATTDTLTPVEYIEHGYQKICEELESELLAKTMQASPAFFERLVVELLVAMGYGGS